MFMWGHYGDYKRVNPFNKYVLNVVSVPGTWIRVTDSSPAQVGDYIFVKHLAQLLTPAALNM